MQGTAKFLKEDTMMKMFAIKQQHIKHICTQKQIKSAIVCHVTNSIGLPKNDSLY